MNKQPHIRKRLGTFRTIILGFAVMIVIGAIILMLPVSSKDGNFTPFNQALFTSVSAACVTGLVVQDTAVYWSAFGKTVIILLIQFGGLGVVTVAACFSLISGRKISLMQRSTMQEAASAPTVGGIVRLTWFIIRATVIFELLGAAALMPSFCGRFGIKGVFMAMFHSVSAFCNAGFDIMGSVDAQFASLTGWTGNIAVNVIIMLLIVCGGLGFITWDDIRTHKLHLRRYRLQSKLILVTNTALILVPALLFCFMDFAYMPVKERLLSSFFQSVTTRTAGFNTADLSSMSSGGKAIMIFLMLTGGSPGSTAGGMKTTTLAVLTANVLASWRRKNDVQCFGRRIPEYIIKNAAAILVMYLVLAAGSAFVISAVEGLPVTVCLFETASAVGTVGLTLGITTELGLISQCILIVLMFFGRVGGLTLIYAALSNRNHNISKLPQEKITVG